MKKSKRISGLIVTAPDWEDVRANAEMAIKREIYDDMIRDMHFIKGDDGKQYIAQEEGVMQPIPSPTADTIVRDLIVPGMRVAFSATVLDEPRKKWFPKYLGAEDVVEEETKI